MPVHRDVWWLLGSATAAICAAPLLVHGDAAANARRAAAVQTIEQLSPDQRQELEENLKLYEQLSTEDRAKYRSLHEKVQENPQAREALEVFSDWWPTVSAREQAELFRQTDVRERVATVDRFQQEIDEERIRRAYFGRGFRWEGPRSRELSFHSDTFFDLMETLEAIATEKYAISPEQKQELLALPPRTPERALKLVTDLHASKSPKWSQLMTAADEKRLLDAIEDEKLRELVEGRGDSRFTGGRMSILRYALAMSLGRQLYVKLLQQQPDEGALLNKLDSLTEDEAADLYAYSADDIRFQLRWRAISEQMADSRAAFTPVREFFEIGGPGFSGSGFGGDRGRGDGSRGGPRNDGPRNDGPRGEGPRGDGFRGDGPPRPNDNNRESRP